MKICCISDTHTLKLPDDTFWPDADVLVYAGDMTSTGRVQSLVEFNDYIGGLPYEKKIVIAGNHDWCFQRNLEKSKDILTNCIYLHDEAITIDGVKFYGTPWQPEFCGWAFNLPRNGEELKNVWSKIPDDTDVLITHGPPFGILDRTLAGDVVGCELLLEELARIKPKAHIFGHIHEGYGVRYRDEIMFVNASVCDFRYRPVNLPILIDLDDPNLFLGSHMCNLKYDKHLKYFYDK